MKQLFKFFKIIPVFLGVFLLSCSNNNIVFFENKIFDNKKWDRKNLVTFKYNVEDTIGSYNIYITIKINANYSRQNLYLFSTILNPENKKLRDTINLLLADEKGKFYGKSNLGDTYYNNFLYKRFVRFPKKGTYTFIFEQAMRSQIIDNIEDFGLKIEKIK
jgi:gliding motility-associated lipoprotein GldH